MQVIILYITWHKNLHWWISFGGLWPIHHFYLSMILICCRKQPIWQFYSTKMFWVTICQNLIYWQFKCYKVAYTLWYTQTYQQLRSVHQWVSSCQSLRTEQLYSIWWYHGSPQSSQKHLKWHFNKSGQCHIDHSRSKVNHYGPFVLIVIHNGPYQLPLHGLPSLGFSPGQSVPSHPCKSHPASTWGLSYPLWWHFACHQLGYPGRLSRYLWPIVEDRNITEYCALNLLPPSS